MKRKAVSGIMLTLLFIGILSLTFEIQPVEAPYPIIYIKADGAIDPSTANITSSDNVTYTFMADINASIVVEKNNIVVDGAGYTLQGAGSGTGIDLSYTNNVTLKNVEVTNFTTGIYLAYSNNNNITGNIASNNSYYGIYLDVSSNNNTVTGNNVSNNGDGIFLWSSSNNTVIGNTASSNNYEGIQLSDSSNNTVTGNTASNNYEGIQLLLSSNNTVIGNTASNNIFGIYLWSSSNNTVIGNNASNNYSGIYFDFSSKNTIIGNTVSSNNYYGIRLYSSSNNTLFHNNLIDNTKQVEVSLGDVDAWDDGVEGNYWSDYTGVDLNSDGIGDSWYSIAQNNTDHYPLMGMFNSFNTTLGKYVNVISNSTVDSFRYFESNRTIIIHVSNMTADQTHGFCRVGIPYEVMSEPFNVTIDGANPTYWNYTLYDNGTHRWIYFEYEHTTREIVIIPEFPAFLILPLFIIVTLPAVIVYRRKHSM